MKDLLRDSLFGQLPRSTIGEEHKVGQRQDGVSLKSGNELEARLVDEDSTESAGAVSRPNHNENIVLVSWYSPDDPQNPQNWSLSKRLFIYFIMCFYTFCVYLGSSIYTPSTEGVMKKFNVSYVPATLGLALYILGYGTGPLLWSPLSEYVFLHILEKEEVNGAKLLARIPAVGRSPPYVITFALFVVLCVPAALTDSFGGLCIVRFLMGFFGSPALTTGAATYQDMFPPIKMPYLLALWGGSATLRPAIGPVVAGFSVAAQNWRWSQWEMLWVSGPIFLFLFIFMPETNPNTILMQRARRLRQITGQSSIKSQSETNQSHMSSREIVYFALIKPWEINILDPSVLFTTVLKPAILGAYMIPIGVFIFAWTARPNVHWMPSIVGVGLNNAGQFFILQPVFMYLTMTYPRYAASLMAANDFARSALAAVAVLVSRPMFTHLGVQGGVSLLGGLNIVCIGGVYIMYYYGSRLRARNAKEGVTVGPPLD
ncbi:hypothetical protein B7463_g12343, partial [Scytalidium lignicola]